MRKRLLVFLPIVGIVGCGNGGALAPSTEGPPPGACAEGGPTCGTASDAGGNDAGRDGGSFTPPSDAGAASCFAVDRHRRADRGDGLDGELRRGELGHRRGARRCGVRGRGVRFRIRVRRAHGSVAMDALRGLPGGHRLYAGVYGELLWDRDEPGLILDLQGNEKGTFEALPVPSFAGNTVFYDGFVDGGQGATALTAVDIPSGATKWSFTADTVVCTPAVVAGASGQVFVGSQSGKVYELDEETGAQKSSATAADGGSVNCGVENASMAISGNRLLVSAGNTLVAY
jgi:hypothetical protein